MAQPVYYGPYQPQQPYQYQDQLNQLRGMQYQPQPVQTTQSPYMNGQPFSQGGFICCPVTSREEAVAFRVEAFGPAVIMPDLGHGMIYFKRFNDKTATADFSEFQYCTPQNGGTVTQEHPQGIDIPAILCGFTKRIDELGQKVDSIIDRLETKPAARQQKKVQVENE